MKFAKFITIGLLLPLLTSCATSERVSKSLTADREEALTYRQQAKDNAASAAVTRTSRAKLSGQQLSLQDMQQLPAIFSQPVSYSTAGQTLEEALAVLSRQLRIPIRIAESVSDSGTLDSSQSHLPQAQTWLQVQWQGNLRGLLDQLAQASRLYWRYHEGRVEFFLYETRHFQVHLPIGNRSVSASISGGGSNGQSIVGSGPNASSQNIAAGTGNIEVNTSAIEINPYASLTSTISAMLLDEGQTDIVAAQRSTGASSGGTQDSVNAINVASDNGSLGGRQSRGRSRVVVSPELGMVTVTAPPPSLDRVASYLDGVNQRFARNVLIDLKIYDVALDDKEGAGLSADIVFSRLNRYGLEVVGAPTVGFGSTAPGQAVLEVSNPNSKFNGSQLVAEALSSFGSLSVTTSGQVMAINGQPAPLQIAEEINYLASTSTTITGSLDPQRTTSLTPGSRVVGLTANFLPTILADNRILLQYQLTMSSLLALDTISSGGASIQIPRIASQSVQQQAFVRDGQTLVLFGFEQTRSGMDGSVSLLGASRVATGKRSLRVIVMQIHGGNKDV
jgi:hypothetical protein